MTLPCGQRDVISTATIRAVAWCCCLTGVLCAQEPVDFEADIQPLFSASCAGGACHLGQRTSGVELTSWETTMSSVGRAYGAWVVVPFAAAASPLYDKISNAAPAHGARMPLGRPPLDAVDIELVARWIDAGARPSATLPWVRGDFTRDERLGITDAIAILSFLFHGGTAPYCDPLADVDADDSIALADAVYLLAYLFRGGPPPSGFDSEEVEACTLPNRPPEIEPIGTVEGREGVELEFEIFASDPDDDRIAFVGESVPDGLTIEAPPQPRSPARVTWTPGFGSAGDHRIRIRVTDSGLPPLDVLATGLIRVREGNHPPELRAADSVWGREGVTLRVELTASDPDGDRLTWELLNGPEGATLDPATGAFEWTPSIGDAGEHSVLVRVTDDGVPPRSVESEWTLVVLAADSPLNQPPTVPALPVYRSHPGLPIAWPIGASDPDGHELAYAAASLPDGAELDSATGELRWTPTAEQLGPHWVPFAITDDGVPPAMVEGVLILRIAPLDSCNTPDCDPATGCEEVVTPIDTPCCVEEPTVRVAEPTAGCPEGRVLYAGRNSRGFGRLQNCDWLRVEPFGQGGHTVRLNAEFRCVNVDEPVSIRWRLETADWVLFDSESARMAQVRADGFAQRIGFFHERQPAGARRSDRGRRGAAHVCADRCGWRTGRAAGSRRADARRTAGPPRA